MSKPMLMGTNIRFLRVGEVGQLQFDFATGTAGERAGDGLRIPAAAGHGVAPSGFFNAHTRPDPDAVFAEHAARLGRAGRPVPDGADRCADRVPDFEFNRQGQVDLAATIAGGLLRGVQDAKVHRSARVRGWAVKESPGNREHRVDSGAGRVPEQQTPMKGPN